MARISNAIYIFINLQIFLRSNLISSFPIKPTISDDVAMMIDTKNHDIKPVTVSIDIFEHMIVEDTFDVTFTTPSLDAAVIPPIRFVTVEPILKEEEDVNDRKKGASTFFISLLISVIFLALSVIFIPLNFGTLKTFIIIAKNKQPMFLLFAAVHLVCISDLMVAITEGILLWKRIPHSGCEFLGAVEVTIFFSLSFILSSVCVYRIIAVLRPLQYKKFAKRTVILKIISVIVFFSILLAVLLIVTKTLRFRYQGTPHSMGCSLFMVKNIFHLFASLLTMVSLLVNFILASTYCVLFRYFRKPFTATKEVKLMKKGALFVTSLSTFSYFICYFPAVVVNILLSIDSEIILGLAPSYRLMLEFAVVLFPHLYSCVLPLCLVTGKTLTQVGKAAEVTKPSIMRSRSRKCEVL